MEKVLKWFRYDQNNSGGGFTGPAIEVWVQAATAGEADAVAESIGLYFNGVEEDMDCPCCGDRWYPAYGDGEEEPVSGATSDMREESAEALNIPHTMLVVTSGGEPVCIPT